MTVYSSNPATSESAPGGGGLTYGVEFEVSEATHFLGFRYYLSSSARTGFVVAALYEVGGSTKLSETVMPHPPAATSHLSSNVPDYAFDGSTSTWWTVTKPTSGNPRTLAVGYNDAHEVAEYTIHPLGTSYSPTAWTFEGTNGDGAWTVIETRSVAAFSTNQTFTLASPVTFQSYRWVFTSGGSTYIALLEVTLGPGAPSTTLGWNERYLDSPYLLTPDTRYRAAILFPTAAPPANGSMSADLTSGPLTVFSNANGTNGNHTYATGATAIQNPALSVGANYQIDVIVGDAPIEANEGSLSGTAPSPEGHFTGTVPATGVLAGVAPSPAGHFTGTAPTAGTLNGESPSPVGAFTGSAGSVSGSVNGTAPTPEGAFTGTVPVVGEVNGTAAPAPVGAFLGDVTVPGGADVFVGAAPAAVGAFEGQNLGELDDIDVRPVRVSVAPRLHTVPVPAPIPASLASSIKPVIRVSHVAPALTEANAPLTEGVDYPIATPVVVGWERLFVDDVDVTYWRDTPVIISRLSSSTPFGYSAASIEVPALQAWEEPGEGEADWMRPDAPVKVALVDENDEIIQILWSGFISKDSADLGEGRKVNGFTCDGITWQAGYAQHEPPHYMPPTDIGTVVPDLLNSVPGKRYSDIPRVVTGIMTRTRGSSAQKKGQVANEILQKEGWTLDGRQWTIDEVAPDEYRMVLKAPASEVHATVTYGAFGVDVNLERDQASRIDLIYGVGNAPNGGQWRGTRFPGLVIATPPPYPNSGGESIHVGDTDADTSSGTGVTVWQTRMVELGYSLNIDGTYSTLDAQALYRLQGRMGLLEDGVLGPQSWSGTFNRGPEGIDLTQWREPLAGLPWTREHHRDPNGVILDDNPAFAGTAKVQHPVEIHYGENITWDGAKPLAEKLLAVESTPALTGQIVLRTDPHELSRRHLKAGQNIKVVGFRGRDVVLRIARIDLEADGRVILAVDERGRDALTVEQIRARDLAAMADPVRRPGNPNRESRIARDRYVQWDIDSPCGFLPETAVFGGLWICPNPIPFAEVGRVVKTMLTSTVPFALMLFGLPVKPSQLHAIVGNPLASTDPYRPHTDALNALGWIEAWGSQGDRCGFSPGQESQDYAFSGEFVEIGGFDFISGRPPYVWPALYSSTTGFIGGAKPGGWGRFYPDTAA